MLTEKKIDNFLKCSGFLGKRPDLPTHSCTVLELIDNRRANSLIEMPLSLHNFSNRVPKSVIFFISTHILIFSSIKFKANLKY